MKEVIMKKLLLTTALVLMVSLSTAAAGDAPASLNLWDDVQIAGSSDSSITGVRFNLLYGVNQNITGVDFGFPLAVNVVRGDMTGAQFGVFYNQVEGDLLGFQAAVVNNSAKVTGVQFGFVNYTQNLHGVQIGLVNINKGGSGYMAQPPLFPLVNWAF